MRAAGVCLSHACFGAVLYNRCFVLMLIGVMLGLSTPHSYTEETCAQMPVPFVPGQLTGSFPSPGALAPRG